MMQLFGVHSGSREALATRALMNVKWLLPFGTKTQIIGAQ